MREKIKEFFELAYWKIIKLKSNKIFNNDHYQYFYTTYFSIKSEFYTNKKILDIGCGPRGSLEWADMTDKRIGLDPLVDQYLKLSTENHKMTYMKAYSEKIPYEDNYFDVLSSFNSIDHVKDIKTSCSEIKRVLKKDGIFLLIVNVHKYPTFTEPHTIGWHFVEDNFTDFDIIEKKQLVEVKKNKIYVNLRIHKEITDFNSSTGILTAVLRKK